MTITYLGRTYVARTERELVALLMLMWLESVRRSA